MRLQCLFVVLLTFSVARSANILFYQIFSSPSHLFGVLTLAAELQERGHRVTMLSTVPLPKDSTSRHEHIVVEEVAPIMMNTLSDLKVFSNRVGGGRMQANLFINEFSVQLCEAFLNSKVAGDFVTGKRKFDLIVADPLANECVLGLVHVNSAPLVYFGTSGIYPWLTSSLGMPTNIPYKGISHNMHGYANATRFTDRLIHTVSLVLHNLERQWVTMPGLERLWREKVGVDAPSFDAIEREVSLVLLNSHPSVELPLPYTPNVIEVGGIHLKKTKPLSKELTKVIDDSGNAGFVMFGIGSVANAKNMDKAYFKVFAEAFGKLEQKVFWKWEADETPVPVPPNVVMVRWLPQADLLAHPKCRCFVSHGGKLSLIEAVNNSVPLVIIPFFSDQDLHGYMVTDGGYGQTIDVRDLTPDLLSSTVKEIIRNPMYKKAAEKRTSLLVDQPETPLERAVYWTEYVIRHKGAPHLRPYARHMTWWQYHLVDVWVTIAAAVLLLISAVITIVKLALKLCRHSKPPPATQKKRRVKKD